MAVSLKKYFGLKEAVLLIIGLFVFFAVLRFVQVDLEKTIFTLQNTPIYIIFAFVLIRALGYLIGNYKWKILVDKIKRTDFNTLLPIYMSGNILDNLVPGPGFGAEPIKAYYLGKVTKKDAATCFATALMDNVLLSFIIAAYFAFSVLYMYLFIKVFAIRVATGILLLFFLFLGIATFYFYKKREHGNNIIQRFLLFIYNIRALGFLRKKYRTFEKFKDAFTLGIGNFKGAMRILWRDKRRIYYVLFLTFIITVLGYLGHYVLLIGYGIDVKIYALIAVITLADLIGYYSPVPAGTGIVEGGRIPLLIFIGVPAEIAAAVTVIERVAFYFSTYGIGYLALVHINLKYLK